MKHQNHNWKINYNKKILLLLALLIIPLVNAQVAIQSFTSFPSNVLPGEEVQLKIALENVGKDDIENILVSLDLSQVPFAPLGSSTEKVIDKIKDDNEETIYFNLIALPNAEPQIYKIPIKISYNETSKTSLISLEVRANANLDVILEESEVVKVNDQGKITLKFVNNGLTQIKFLKVSLKDSPAYEILSPKTIYIGEVDIDDFETEEFIIIPKLKNPQLTLELEYRDSNNKELKDSRILNLNVYTIEEAKQLGLVKSNFNSIWIILIIIIVIAIIIYRKRKKNVT